MSWASRWLWPLSDIQADVLYLRTSMTDLHHFVEEIRAMTGAHELHHPPPTHGLEARVEVLERANHHLVARINRMENTMATQADIDALTTKLGDLKTSLTSADAGIQAEIDALKAANPSVDVTGLQAAVDALSTQVDATSALVPAPTPPPAG